MKMACMSEFGKIKLIFSAKNIDEVFLHRMTNFSFFLSSIKCLKTIVYAKKITVRRLKTRLFFLKSWLFQNALSSTDSDAITYNDLVEYMLCCRLNYQTVNKVLKISKV